MNTLVLKSFAKINLGIEIVGKRKDGYHNVRTILQSITLHDKITLRKYSNGIRIRCTMPLVPTDERNLVYKAADIFFKKKKMNSGIKIAIRKNIPVGAGLGGGSSNAAATLRGLNELFNGGMAYRELFQMSKKLGSDVPFFLKGGTALVEGRGDKLSYINCVPNFWAVIVFPGFSISSLRTYERLDPKEFSSNSKKVLKVESLLNAIKRNNLEKLCKNLMNGFEDVIFKKHSEIKKIKEGLVSKRAIGASLCGSGSSVFGVFKTKDQAEKTLLHFSDLGYSVWIVKSCKG